MPPERLSPQPSLSISKTYLEMWSPLIPSLVTLSIRSGPRAATLGGTLSVAALAGVATFDDISLLTDASYTLKAADGRLMPVTSNRFLISQV